jgi:ABC-2 type transport system permease protein
MKPATAEVPTVGRGFDPAALAALFVLTLRQQLHGRRLIVLSLLFVLPSALAVLLRLAPHPPTPGEMEFGLIFVLIPQALAPLTSLLYAAGVVRDEVEEQTLTYLLLRPLPRWALYLTRLAAAWLVTSVLTGFFTLLTFIALWWNSPGLWSEVLTDRALKTVALLALAQVAYCAWFGLLGLWTRRALLVGLLYIVAFEGMLSNYDLVVRRLTVTYYFRVLVVRWLNPPDSKVWALNLPEAPGAGECVATLLGASAVLVIIGMVRMMREEFRMKTPEGS